MMHPAMQVRPPSPSPMMMHPVLQVRTPSPIIMQPTMQQIIMEEEDLYQHFQPDVDLESVLKIATEIDEKSVQLNPETEFERKLFVRNLAFSTTKQDLVDFFSRFGDVEFATIKYDRINGELQSKGFGFVTFREKSSLMKAIQNREKVIDGRIVSCHIAFEEKLNRPINRFGK
jgi:cold-inducible RNA-binding protein